MKRVPVTPPAASRAADREKAGQQEQASGHLLPPQPQRQPLRRTRRRTPVMSRQCEPTAAEPAGPGGTTTKTYLRAKGRGSAISGCGRRCGQRKRQSLTQRAPVAAMLWSPNGGHVQPSFTPSLRAGEVAGSLATIAWAACGLARGGPVPGSRESASSEFALPVSRAEGRYITTPPSVDCWPTALSSAAKEPERAVHPSWSDPRCGRFARRDPPVFLHRIRTDPPPRHGRDGGSCVRSVRERARPAR